ncbi:hypothetical protein SAMN05216599_12170 [Pseudomonas cichorii]|nr:hypothetical protein SAMN05216599_12170 [Pseudomonas cichorii]
MKSPNRESRANGLLWSLRCNDHSIQPVQALPKGSFYYSRPGCGASPKYNSSPKESVSCASAVLFLLCVSRFVLFLLWVSTACCSSCTKDIAEGVPTFLNPMKPGLCGVSVFWAGTKKPGFVTVRPGVCYVGGTKVTVLLTGLRTPTQSLFRFRWRPLCGAECPVADGVPTGTCG